MSELVLRSERLSLRRCDDCTSGLESSIEYFHEKGREAREGQCLQGKRNAFFLAITAVN